MNLPQHFNEANLVVFSKFRMNAMRTQSLYLQKMNVGCLQIRNVSRCKYEITKKREGRVTDQRGRVGLFGVLSPIPDLIISSENEMNIRR